MVGMKGTRKGELAIDHILNAKMPDGSPRVKIVGFGLPEEWVGDSADARTIIDPSTQQQIIVFNPMNRSADPFQLSNHLYHETLHWDLTNSKTEETVIKSLQEPMYLEQLVNHPEMARDPSRIARRNNSNAYARLMGGVNGKIGVFESEHPNEPLLPGSGIPATTLLELIGKIL